MASCSKSGAGSWEIGAALPWRQHKRAQHSGGGITPRFAANIPLLIFEVANSSFEGAMPESFGRPPIVAADGSTVKLHFPLSDGAKYPFSHRTIVVGEALVARKLKVPPPIGAHNLESFGRRMVDLIARAAVAQHNSQSTHHLVKVDDPPGSFLPDIIVLRSL